MGIRNLNTILKRYAPNAISHEASVDDYRGKRVAVDVSVYLHKYKSIYGKTWLNAFYAFMKSLSEIKCVFVFDSKACPKEKLGERQRRSNLRHAQRANLDAIKAAVEEYMKSGSVAHILEKFSHTNDDLAKLIPSDSDTPKSVFSIDRAQSYIDKLENQLRVITSKDFSDVKLMCRSLGFATIDATLEAEFMCALLCHEKKVDAVMTEDTDAYAYLSPVLLTKVSGTRFYEIRIGSVLAELGMNNDQFVDMCILCGTDYSPKVRGVGPIRAYRMIKTRGSFEAVSEKEIRYATIKSIDYDSVRALFTIRPSGVDTIDFPESDTDSLPSLLDRCIISPEKPLRRILK